MKRRTKRELQARHESKLREYERIHKEWMDTSIHNEEARTRICSALDIARAEYLTARAQAWCQPAESEVV